MKIYKYWKVEKEIIHINNQEVPVICYGGSNISEEDARTHAFEKSKLIQRKILGEKRLFEGYDSEIREEIIEQLSENAVITRNRYGAQVLNIEKMLIIDIDKPKNTFMDIFKPKDIASNKLKITTMVEEYARKTINQGLAFRIYETNKGMRIIVLGREHSINDAITINIMKDLNCDPLYLFLCKKQQCYRARLTPKPSLMKMKGIKISYPREEDLKNKCIWIAEYEAKRLDYCVCKYINQVGESQLSDSIVSYHDRVTGAFENRKLA